MRPILLAILPLWLVGIELVSPGHSSLDPSHVRTGKDSLIVLLSQNDQLRPVGVMVFETQSGENDLLSRTERLNGLDGAVLNVESFALNARTLAPVFRIVAGRERTTTGEAFYPNSVDIVLAALPLANGYSAELALENEGTDLEPTGTVRVRGVEQATLPNGEVCPSWDVEVVIGEKRGIYLIDQESHKLVRYSSPSEGLLINRIRGCGRD